jgi:hypothetical protein
MLPEFRQQGFVMVDSDHFEKPEKRSSILEPDSKYRQTCRSANSGFNSSAERRSEVHHILCNHSVAKRQADYKDDGGVTMKYVENCLWITEWDLNNKDNLIGLPRNRQLRECYGKEPEKNWNPVDLPSHQVDHNTADGYTNEVRKWLKANLWDTLNATQKQHKVDAETIKKQLEDGSTHFKKMLISRGSREMGTKICWKLQHDKGYERRWYHPFSMGKKPSHRQSATSKTDMTGIFKKLG